MAVMDQISIVLHDVFELDLVYGVGVDKESDFIRYAETIGAIQKNGAWYNYGEERLGQGLTNTVNCVSLNPELKAKIKADIEKMRKSKNRGEINSQFGTMWITNGEENKKLKLKSDIPEGWYKGRKMKF